MNVFTAIAIVLFINVVLANERIVHGAVDCAMGSSSCESCHAAYPFCYWCQGTCRRYYGKSIAKIECGGKMMYESCDSSELEKGSSKVEDILAILSALKKRKSKETQISNIGGDNELPSRTESPSNKAKLARLLKLLKMLAYLEEKKAKNKGVTKGSSRNKGSVVTDIGNGILKTGKNLEEVKNQVSGKQHASSSTNDLDALLKLVARKTETPPSVMLEQELKTEKAVPDRLERVQSVVDTRKQSHVMTTTMSTTKKTTKTQFKPARKQKIPFTNATNTPRITTRTGQYCELFEQEDECNGDKDCSWCNILDLCVGRTKEDFKYCTGEKRNADVKEQSDPDVCSEMTTCSTCTKKGKCFWCEKTKSCHIYPFFGFIPHNCPANMWYYKECDVQLAIFIILFPLLMILLSMVIFYFCLRFCYYRKKMLKVQLFEKPELFERRKGKKVYFVGGDDDDDDETRTEQIRKKYNLPHEKEPLISP